MRKLMLSLGAVALVAAVGGCHHYRDAYYGDRADYHHERAKADASHGDFLHALHNEHKAAHDEARDARHDYD